MHKAKRNPKQTFHQAWPKMFKDSSVVFTAQRGHCGSDRSLYAVSRCQTNRGSGVRPWVVTVQPIQRETQTEHLCVAAKGLRGGDPVSECFNLHYFLNISAVWPMIGSQISSYGLTAWSRKNVNLNLNLGGMFLNRKLTCWPKIVFFFFYNSQMGSE